MQKNFVLLLLLFLLTHPAWAEIREISKQWRFHLGEVPEATSFDFDDTAWQKLNLPHDWAFENGYHEDGAQKDRGGYAIGGIGWYRKKLVLSKKEMQSERIFLDFEAVYRNATVWLNGKELGHCAYGYLPFSYDVTSVVREGTNVLTVRVDNALEPSARWYHGCGIYGNVYLRTHGDVFFEKDGTFVACADSQGEVVLKSYIQNLRQRADVTCNAVITGPDGFSFVAKPIVLSRLIADTATLSLTVPAPRLWSPENPVLYKLELNLTDATDQLLDHQTINVGFRELDWDVRRGFFLNGQQYKLRGVCEHLEGGPTGAMYTPQLMRWKLQLLKNMGCNAIRTAHNPQLPYFYDLCDEMGFLVMDEVFDGWKRKADFDYGMQAFAKNWEKDLRTIIRRDRNHPSVFMYSVGNETRGPMAADLVRVCHAEDPTRKVTSGTAGTDAMDVEGVNGHSEAKKFLDTYQPTKKPFIATENPHTWQVRGFYRSKTWYRDGYNSQKEQMMFIPDLTEQEIFTYDWTDPAEKKNRKQVFNSSYDNATVRVTARQIIAALRDNPWFSGSFRWTGFDYLGEAGYVHGGWPFRAFQSGAIDLAGFPKDLFYLYQSEWGNKDMVHILPHWTHPLMKKGTEIPVWVYTSGDEVELFLNGTSIGRRKKGQAWNEIQCQFMVPWIPGTIEAVAYRGGVEIGRTHQTTSEAPSCLNIEVENKHLKADGKDISIVTIRQEDAKGTLYPYGENRVHVALKGAVRVLSFENGSPVDTECNFNAVSRRCFFGLNRLFLQSTGGEEAQPASVFLGAIIGDKKLQQSDKITITCVEKSLRGKLPQRDLHIYYTTDGTEPTPKSMEYVTPFSLTKETTVKAVAYDGDRVLMRMVETFGPNEGLYWGKSGEDIPVISGEQAEQLSLTDCQLIRGGQGAEGGAYVMPHPGKGILSWYQENDGGVARNTLTVRYSQSSEGKIWRMALYNNNKMVRKLEFPDTGSANCNWRELSIPVIIHPGANQLSLRSISSGGAPCIDKIKIE